MKVQSDPRELARAAVLADYRPANDAIAIVKEKHSGKDAVFAVAFEDRDGVPRRGLIGMCRHHGDIKNWRPSGAFMGSARLTDERDVWMTWGGWGPPGSPERAVFGGWVADPAAASARAIDNAGRTLHDDVKDGVALFMHKGPFLLMQAQLELLDAQGRVLRTGPMRRERRVE